MKRVCLSVLSHAILQKEDVWFPGLMRKLQRPKFTGNQRHRVQKRIRPRGPRSFHYYVF